MGKRLGTLIRTARNDAGLTQAQLAARLIGVSASEIGRYERGEAEPTRQVVKDIAKALGVTQKSLLDAMPQTPSSTTSGSGSSMRLTTTERRLVELYRAASTENRRKALKVLRGEVTDMGDIMQGIGGIIGDALLKK